MTTGHATNQLITDIVDNKKVFTQGQSIECQIRYHGQVKQARIVTIDHSQREMTLEFKDIDASMARGQSVVFYNRDECLGGGIVA